MAIQARDILRSARLLLTDPDSVRWTLPELLGWISEAQRRIVEIKPNASTETVELNLVEGTRQAHGRVALTRVVRNLVGTQRAVTTATRETLDAVMPGWHSSAVLPYGPEADHVVQDAIEPDVFYVVPGNDGTGKIEAVVVTIPPQLLPPVGAQDKDIDKYNIPLGVPDIYQATILEYVLYRAFSKDEADPSSAGRAVAHRNAFYEALGYKLQGETVMRTGSTGATE